MPVNMILASMVSPGYSLDSAPHDVRVFPSIAAARSWLHSLYAANGSRYISSTYADGTSSSDLYPCIEIGTKLVLSRVPPLSDPSMSYYRTLLELAESFLSDSTWITHILRIGPNAGISTERI